MIPRRGAIERSMQLACWSCLPALLGGFPLAVDAREVVLAGVFPGKALIVVDGGAPKAVGVGTTTADGVRIIGADSEGATVEVDGRRFRLVVGQHAVNVSRSRDGGGRATGITIQGDLRGQFQVTGTVNGASMLFMVDTGATFVSLGRSDALKAGVDFTKGEPAFMQTANGVVRAWRVSLDTVRVGDVTLRNVDGIVHGTDMPFALLGMSFLNRMELRREGTSLQLRQRY